MNEECCLYGRNAICDAEHLIFPQTGSGEFKLPLLSMTIKSSICSKSPQAVDFNLMDVYFGDIAAIVFESPDCDNKVLSILFFCD